MPNLYFRHMLPILLCLIVLTLPAQADELIERTYAPFAQLLEQFLSEHERDDGGRLHSLDQIEKEILLGDEFKRRGWKEARVHSLNPEAMNAHLELYILYSIRCR